MRTGKSEVLVISRPLFDLLETMRVDTDDVVNIERLLARRPGLVGGARS